MFLIFKLSKLIENNQKKIIFWFSAVRVRVMPSEEVAIYDPNQLAFLINTLEEPAQAEQIMIFEQN
jgi:hypothetical protein